MDNNKISQMMELYYDKPGVLINDIEDDDQYFEQAQIEFNIMDQTIKNLCQEIMSAQDMKAGNIDFIGAQPVSLSKITFDEILKYKDDWLVCEKTDGFRYLMLILSNGHVYLTGRNSGALQQQLKQSQFFRIKVNLPRLIESQGQIFVQEIFDGEIIVDKLSQDKSIMNYLIFDTLLHNSKQRVYQNDSPICYYDRLRCAEEFLEYIQTLKHHCKDKIPIEMYQLQFFPKISIILKDFFQIYQLKYLINQYIPTLPHGNDGIIFTQNRAYYRPGTCKFIQKWKPPYKNTIDFLIIPNKKFDLSDENDGILELYLMTRTKEEVQLMFFDFVYTTKEKVIDIEEKINELYESQKNSSNIFSVKGVVAECALITLPKQQEKLAKLMQPKTFGYAADQLEYFFVEILKYTQHFLRQNFVDQFKNDQIQLLSQVREMIHLKNNFQSSWKIEKYRIDKTTPNYFGVGLNILKILDENLTANDLMEQVEQKVLKQI